MIKFTTSEKLAFECLKKTAIECEYLKVVPTNFAVFGQHWVVNIDTHDDEFATYGEELEFHVCKGWFYLVDEEHIYKIPYKKVDDRSRKIFSNWENYSHP